MSTITLDRITVHPGRRLRWNQVKQRLVEWRHRAGARNELMALSDRCLQDIGMSRCTSVFETSKPFWVP